MKTRTLKQLLFATVVLAGCAGTAISVQAAGQAAAGQESVQPGSDTWITTKVKAAFGGFDGDVQRAERLIGHEGCHDHHQGQGRTARHQGRFRHGHQGRDGQRRGLPERHRGHAGRG
ncbi:exported hypothetical protein [uncultured Stenotrophomonas sp.]|uniref:Lipoprotein n=1 Tax=uncultured Stenotrophomonas sp. TaxID=165438 RepID=A0A1Y5Q5J0_9GAMM|nr:exported hypothetical protein [uncultured Stenotrophomonas sp.]